ncbi:MAG: YihY/virulence factor BrkB family protein [Actinomycetes bacterium]
MAHTVATRTGRGHKARALGGRRARSWVSVVRRTASEFRADDCTDWAAALTYYAVLSLFPGLVVMAALLGLLGNAGTVDTLLTVVRDITPASAVQAVEQPLHQIVEQRGPAGAVLGFGLFAAVWSASGYVSAFSRVANVIYDVEEGRPLVRRRALQVLVTVLLLVLVALVAMGLVLSGPLADAVGSALGLGDLTVTLWGLLKWPVLALVVSAILTVLYRTAPDVSHRRARWFTPGGLLALLVWFVASAAFGVYVANFGSFGATYGALGTVIVFMVWLWITNLAILFGAEFDSVLEADARAGADDAAAADARPEPGPDGAPGPARVRA